MNSPKAGDTLPTVTVVIATCNSERTIDGCLQSVRDQVYPHEVLDILCADGGSTDRTLEIARRFGANIIS
ncbi:MAG: glycosyltransferase, partial [bacterium]|nr:glycosyltransferase [bacterium]